MLRAERFFPNGHCSFLELYCVGVISSLPIHRGQIIQRDSQKWVVWTECLFFDGDSAFVERFRGPCLHVCVAEITESLRNIDTFWAQNFFFDGQLALENRPRRGIVAPF